MRLIFQGSALSPRVAEEAEGYDTPEAMFKAGVDARQRSIKRVWKGVGAVAAGAAWYVIQRNAPEDHLAAIAPRALAASGVTLIASGMHGRSNGSTLQDGAGQIMQALINHEAEIVPDQG